MMMLVLAMVIIVMMVYYKVVHAAHTKPFQPAIKPVKV